MEITYSNYLNIKVSSLSEILYSPLNGCEDGSVLDVKDIKVINSLKLDD